MKPGGENDRARGGSTGEAGAPVRPEGGAVPAPPVRPEGGAVAAPPVLDVRDLHAGYRDVPVLRGVSLTVGPAEIVALVGANGAGKTTTLRAIAGLLAPAGGKIYFDGARIDGMPPHEVVARGLVLTPEGRKIFPSLTVRENLDLGSYLPAARARRRASIDRAMALFPILAERQRQAAGTLSGGEQQMLAIARALMTGPRLLMLDEPSLGLAPLVVDQIFEVIQAINRDGTPVLLVEQNVHRSLALAMRAYVFEQGAVMLAGAASALAARGDVRRAYLGL
jgi:branched-chain amino acid transport system ATP-binding protein